MKFETIFPLETSFSEEYLKANYWQCLYTKSNDYLHYWIVLPNNVKPFSIDKIKNKDLNLTEIGFYSRIDESPYIEITVGYETILYDINCSDWLKKKLYLMGEVLLQERKIQGKTTGFYLDVLTSKNEGEKNIISRYTTMKDYNPSGGANYFLVKVSCYSESYKELAETMYHISSNWDLINKSNWQMAEMLKPFDYNFNEPIEFYYPASWDAKYSINNNNNLSQFLFEHTIDGDNKGIIISFFYENEKFKIVDEVYNNSIQRLKNREEYSLEISAIKELSINNINTKIKELFTLSGSISSLTFNAFIQIYIIRTLKGWYYFESIGSNPNLKNYNWEINKRALQLIVKSFNNLEFEDYDKNNKFLKNKNFYKTYKGKNYTKEEWENMEQKLYENYVQKNNLGNGNTDCKKEIKKKGEGFFLDEKDMK